MPNDDRVDQPQLRDEAARVGGEGAGRDRGVVGGRRHRAGGGQPAGADAALLSLVAAARLALKQFEPGSIHDFTGSTNLMQFVMALRSCSVVISNDCGGLHLANALGVATVGLYGVTNPVYTKPIFNSPVEIVQPSDCPNYGGTSSKQICLSQVIEAIADLVVQPEHAERETTLVS